MKIKFNSKYNTISAYFVIVFVICTLIVTMIIRYEAFMGIVNKVLKVLSPIIWGLVIAYLLNPVMVRMDKYIALALNKKKEHKKSFIRVLSVTATSIIAIAICSGLIAIMVPEVVKNLSSFINEAPMLFNNLYGNIIEFVDSNPEMSTQIKIWIEEQFSSIQTYIADWLTNLKPFIENMMTKLTSGVSSILVGIKDFLLGFIVSIYLLYNKEGFLAESKKTMYAMISKKRCDKLLVIGKDANDKFIGFLSGKIIDSTIIGILAFISLTIMKMPYTVLVSFIIGVTNIIPFFGPIFGAIPGAILVLIANPRQVIPFIIFVVILQQIDGNIIGPKILGNSIGLPTFWIIFSIFIGGGLFGFVGMVVGVPAFAVIYTLFKNSVNEKLEKKNMSTNADDYKSTEPEFEPKEITKISLPKLKK